MEGYSAGSVSSPASHHHICTSRSIIICIVFILPCKALNGISNWHQTSISHYLSNKAETHYSNTTTILGPNPPMYIIVDDSATFSNEHLNGIQNAVSTISTYLVKNSTSGSIPVLLQSSTHTPISVEPGSTVLASAYIHENKVVFYLSNIVGIDIYLVAIHEFLHILGFGTETWYSLLDETNNYIQFQGKHATRMAMASIDVDRHSRVHWSGKTLLSSGKDGDIMEPYLHEYSDLSAETFAAIHDSSQGKIISLACRTDTDCKLLVPDAPELMCIHQFHDSPGLCRSTKKCGDAKCVPFYADTSELSDRENLISKSIAFLVVVAVGTLRFLN